MHALLLEKSYKHLLPNFKISLVELVSSTTSDCEIKTNIEGNIHKLYLPICLVTC